MPEMHSFDYALVRLVPHVEREEFINVGVILFCRTLGFLAAKIELDTARLRALSPRFNGDCARAHLELIPRLCAGEAQHPVGQLPPAERFHWLVTPRSTAIQVGPVHTGLCANPAEALEHLMATMVRPPG